MSVFSNSSTNRWTPRVVEARLFEAADFLKVEPGVKPPGFLLQDSDVEQWKATLGWLGWLEPEDAKLVCMHLEREPWKTICWQFGITRATANRRWQHALSLIAWRLNNRSLPAKWSRRFLVERVRFLSSEF